MLGVLNAGQEQYKPSPAELVTLLVEPGQYSWSRVY